MPTFNLIGKHLPAFRALDYSTQGYVEAMFFTECEPGTDADSHDPETQSSLHGECGFADLAPEALERIIAQCAAFQHDNASLLELAYERDYDSAQAGRDFWFTRNGHGVGYWDRKALEPDSDEWKALRRPLDTWTAADRALNDRLRAESIGERLSEAARKAGEACVYLGDDGRVYHDGGFIAPAAVSAVVATVEA